MLFAASSLVLWDGEHQGRKQREMGVAGSGCALSEEPSYPAQHPLSSSTMPNPIPALSTPTSPNVIPLMRTPSVHKSLPRVCAWLWLCLESTGWTGRKCSALWKSPFTLHSSICWDCLAERVKPPSSVTKCCTFLVPIVPQALAEGEAGDALSDKENVKCIRKFMPWEAPGLFFKDKRVLWAQQSWESRWPLEVTPSGWAWIGFHL